MKMSLLNMYYFDSSFIVDKHDPNHDKGRILHTLISQIWCVTRVTRRPAKKTPFYVFPRGYFLPNDNVCDV